MYACGDYNTQLLRPDQMHHFQKGFVFGGHMQASYHNMKVLADCGIDKISVLLRDPRDAFVSWVHHLNKLGASARNYHSKIYNIPRAYYDWSIEDQFAFQIRTFLPVTVNWVEGWLDYYASDEKDVDIQFVYFDELKRNPESYLSRILRYHGVETPRPVAFAPPKEGEMHFRKGEHGQWREEFSAHDQQLAHDLMQGRLHGYFDLAAAQHPGLRQAAGKRAAGDLAGAAAVVLTALQDFPNFAEGYMLLTEILAEGGLDASRIPQIAPPDASAEISEKFTFRDDALRALADCVQYL